MKPALWAEASASAHEFFTALNRMKVEDIYKQMYIQDDLDGHPGQGDTMGGDSVLSYKMLVDVYSSLAAKIAAALQ